MHSGILRGVFVACLLMMASGPVTARELLEHDAARAEREKKKLERA